MAGNLDTQLDDFLAGVRSLVPDTAEKQRITEAGAKVLVSDLKDSTKNKHYTDRDTGEDPHLADMVAYQTTNEDGVKDGTSVVGYQRKAYIARMLNDGTIYIKGDRFVENTRNASRRKIFEAQYKEFKKNRGL